jgi:hypothetical protein
MAASQCLRISAELLLAEFLLYDGGSIDSARDLHRKTQRQLALGAEVDKRYVVLSSVAKIDPA